MWRDPVSNKTTAKRNNWRSLKEKECFRLLQTAVCVVSTACSPDAVGIFKLVLLWTEPGRNERAGSPVAVQKEELGVGG